jgi:hypothetical protein
MRSTMTDPGSDPNASELDKALECARASNGIVMALFEVQNATISIDEWITYVDDEVRLVGGPDLLRGLAYLASAYVQIVSDLTGRPPSELVGLGALGVEIGDAAMRDGSPATDR